MQRRQLHIPVSTRGGGRRQREGASLPGRVRSAHDDVWASGERDGDGGGLGGVVGLRLRHEAAPLPLALPRGLGLHEPQRGAVDATFERERHRASGARMEGELRIVGPGRCGRASARLTRPPLALGRHGRPLHETRGREAAAGANRCVGRLARPLHKLSSRIGFPICGHERSTPPSLPSDFTRAACARTACASAAAPRHHRCAPPRMPLAPPPPRKRRGRGRRRRSAVAQRGAD